MIGVNMKHTRASLVLITTLLLSGCAAYSIVPPAPTQVSKASMTVSPASSWNRIPSLVASAGPNTISPKAEIWTQDGPLLNQLTFYGAIKDGEALFKLPSRADTKAPVFKASMLPQEVVEFVEKNYRVQTGSPVFNVTNVKPVTFSGQPGFQFDFDFTTNDEVRRKGRAAGAVKNGALYLIVYEGAAVHYFDRNLAEFDRMVAGATIKG
jgi:hypothetical protein